MIRTALGTWLGKKRNLALAAARGQVVAWFDDDDWQHPDRLTYLMPLLRRSAASIRASFIGPSQSYFIDLHSDRIQPYEVANYAIFNGAVFYTDMVREERFPENVLRTEDTIWISRLLRRHRGAALEGSHPTLFMWLSHDANISNLRAWRHHDCRTRAVPSLFGPTWRETYRQLEALRHRLSIEPAQPPARAIWTEGASLESNRVMRRGLESAVGSSSAPRNVQDTIGFAAATAVLRGDSRSARATRTSQEVSRNGMDLLVYAYSERADRDFSGLGYASLAVRGRRFGMADMIIAAASQRHREWLQSDFVGFINGDFLAGRQVSCHELAREIERTRRRFELYTWGGQLRLSLRGQLNRNAFLAAAFQHVVLTRMGKSSDLLQAELLDLESGFVTRPAILSRLVRNWVVNARVRLNDRADGELRSLLSNTDARACGAALLAVIPALFFYHERVKTHCCNLIRLPVGANTAPDGALSRTGHVISNCKTLATH